MVSRSYVVMGERGVIFLFSAKRPLGKARCPVTCAGQAGGAAFSLFAWQLSAGAGLHFVQAVAPYRKITPRSPQVTDYTSGENSVLP